MNAARDGQQVGLVTTKSVKVVPVRARRLVLGMACPSEAASWSSLITTTMFGLSLEGPLTVPFAPLSPAGESDPQLDRASKAALAARSLAGIGPEEISRAAARRFAH